MQCIYFITCWVRGAKLELDRPSNLDIDNMLTPIGGALIFLGYDLTDITQVFKIMPVGTYCHFDPTESEKGFDQSWMNDFIPGERAKQHHICSSNILNQKIRNMQFLV